MREREHVFSEVLSKASSSQWQRIQAQSKFACEQRFVRAHPKCSILIGLGVDYPEV